MAAKRKKSLFGFFKRAFIEWNRRRISLHSAALSFYTLFSIGPLLFVMIFLLGLIFTQGVENFVLYQVESITGVSGAGILQSAINTVQRLTQNPLLYVAGISILVLSAGTAFNQLQHSLNMIWEAHPKKQKWYVVIKKRVLAFSIVLILTILLILSLIAQGIILYFSRFVPESVTIPLWATNTLYFSVSFVLTLLLFTAIYKILPDKRLRWKEVLFAALLTSVLFIVGEIILSIYFRVSYVSTAYGAAGSLVILLLWVYYCAQIILSGALFTKVFMECYHK